MSPPRPSAMPPILQGGLLLLTSLKGIDGQVYAVAQGSVVTGGFVRRQEPATARP